MIQHVSDFSDAKIIERIVRDSLYIPQGPTEWLSDLPTRSAASVTNLDISDKIAGSIGTIFL